ncbi:unnamed protein product [Cyberlindnera jadinii]|uniref:DUF2423 domain-containing protein n=1 Tax=Cyberlindnera jadinii (strain ATCC 18201 / CBS 1600 / BCRC 20928 / JCM 3617 / NBRC 0987 / NRRL Y-1542) TaxID=983966 RepID=A0A0H5CJN2_CYBJN|nr:hypothetical protein CYBJADRAFT_129142 [Cyberlindnera jadinii NRRL Y-1542]ODV72554.1 hypothetical protein CYBJADRAFT_129142 [Cyberlindnera jadinii NRRL Y-1542]CEP24714.1 unnamed protein product [Cyberlindnera jadinii]
MAKSLRSKPKLRAKSIKRGKEFQKAVDERQNRLANKLKEDLLKQKSTKKADNDKEEEMEVEQDDSARDVKKVSTSGDRNARHHNWKMSNRKKNHTSFARKKKN